MRLLQNHLQIWNIPLEEVSRKLWETLYELFDEPCGWYRYPQPYEAQRVSETGPLLLQDFHLVLIIHSTTFTQC